MDAIQSALSKPYNVTAWGPVFGYENRASTKALLEWLVAEGVAECAGQPPRLFYRVRLDYIPGSASRFADPQTLTALAEHWGWCRKSTRNYLEGLERFDMARRLHHRWMVDRREL